MIQKYQDRDAEELRPEEEAPPRPRRAERGRVDPRHGRRGPPLTHEQGPRLHDEGAAELRADRLHRHADHHGRQEAHPRHLRRVHRPLHPRAGRAGRRHGADPLRGAHAEGSGLGGRDLDQLFEDLFDEPDRATREAIKRKYATKGAIFEAHKLIEAKARDMLRHYVANILPNGLKAQVVAYSRRAAVRYQHAFTEARDDLVQAALALDEETRKLDDLALSGKPAKLRAAVYAARQLDALRSSSSLRSSRPRTTTRRSGTSGATAARSRAASRASRSRCRSPVRRGTRWGSSS